MLLQQQLEYGLMFHLLNGSRDYIDLLEESDFVYLETKEIFTLIKEDNKISNLEICERLKRPNTEILEDYKWNTDLPTERLCMQILIKNAVKRDILQAEPSQYQKITKRLETINTEEIELNSCKFLLDSFDNDQSKVGFSTGFVGVDKYTKGFKHSHFWVIGAYSNVGKTQFAVQAIMSALKHNAKVLFLSIEMREDDIMERFWRYARSKIDEDTAMKFFVQKEKDFKITSKIYQIDNIINMIENSDADIVVIDFLQLIEGKGRSEYEKITETARRLQIAAGQTNKCIIALSQVSNESARQKGDAVMGFKGSGGIAAASDIGLILNRDFEAEKKVDDDYVGFEVNIRKNRFGRTCAVDLIFDRKTGFII